MDLDAIAAYLEANTDLVRGLTLFTEHMPASVREGVVLTSELTLNEADRELAGRFLQGFDVIVRSSRGELARTRSYELLSKLRLDYHSFGTFFADYIIPVTMPKPFRRNEADQVECSVGFEVRGRMTLD